MTTANLTADQLDRIATMDAADADCWTAWYSEQNALAAPAPTRAQVEKAILKSVRGGTEEPVEVRRAVAAPVGMFNEATRMLKRMGCLKIDDAGLFYA